jgi:glycosyltransferase A (GT-A) superfamily protein (DUF2064 family)
MSALRRGAASVLVVGKAPVPGLAKTRLGAEVGERRAAELAALAFLDTLDACERAFAPGRRHVALAGDLTAALRGEELRARLSAWTVIRQRGSGLGARLAHAHRAAGEASGGPVVQIGTDTPQVRPEHLQEVAARLAAGADAVLGPAVDGGWWALGLARPALARVLGSVPMSSPTTCAATRDALVGAGAVPVLTRLLRDVDTAADAAAVAAEAPETRFATSWHERVAPAEPAPPGEPVPRPGPSP